VKVLIADDSATARAVLEAKLVEWGYEVVVTQNGAEAWEALTAEDAPKLAILDWLMPEMDGPEVCRRIREMRDSEPTYLILLTVKDAKEDIIAGLEAGANDYLAKPFDEGGLRARLRVGTRMVELQGSLSKRTREAESANEQLRSEIAERKQAGEQIEKSISLLSATLESTADGILVVDTEGRIVSFNRRFLQMWHIPEFVMTSLDDNQMLVLMQEQLEDPEGFLSEVRRVYSRRSAESHDVLELKDGRILERSSRPQKIGGEPVGRVWSFHDITERERAEQALRESQRRFRDLFESSPDAIFVEDLDGNILDVNPAACDLHGMERGELIGKHVRDLVPPEKREETARDFARMANGELDHLEGLSWTEDERAVPVEIRASRIEYSERSALLLHVRDITGRKQAEAELSQAREKEMQIGARIQQTLLRGQPIRDRSGILRGRA